jgi:ABC-type amino acid transport substrate-binding protein
LLTGHLLIAQSVTELKTEFQDVPPKYVIQDGISSGISFEIMKYVEQKSGYRFIYEESLVPLARVSKNLENGSMDIQFGLQKTPEREKNLIFGPVLYNVRILGVMRVDDPDTFRSLSELVQKQIIVLTPYGTGCASALSAVKGLIVDDGGRSAAANLEKLFNGRGKILIYHNLTINYLLRLPEFEKTFRTVDIDFESNEGFNDVAQYLAYSKNIPDTVRNRINEIIAEAVANGDLARITRKYLE